MKAVPATPTAPSVVGPEGRRADWTRVPPAALTALAESGLLFVPAHLIAVDSIRISKGPFGHYPLFALMLVGAVILATAFRRSPVMRVSVTVGAIGLGVVQGTLWGAAGASGIGTAVVLTLAVALRVVMLASRDWREPIGDSFAVGTAVLLVEVMAVGHGDPVRALVPPIVILFFLGSLASRAASVWLAVRPARAERGVASAALARPHRSLFIVLGVLAALMTVALVLGGPHGVFEVTGGFVYTVLTKVFLAMGWVVAEALLRPLYWLLTKVHISAEGVSRVAARLRALRPSTTRNGGGSSLVERVIGVLLFAGMFSLLVLTIRRRWRLLADDAEQRSPDPAPDRRPMLAHHLRKRLPRLRRELPADTVRRWYAEALLSLERLGLVKHPSRTPGEYLGEVSRTFPESASGFTALTRAYEDVRYGSARMEGDALARLGVERDRAMEALSHARKIDDPDQA